MRERQLVSVALALGFCALGHANCQAPDEIGGQVMQIQTNVGSGYNCGRVSTPLYCYGIPVNMGSTNSGNGSLWVDTYVTGYNAGKGFIAFNGVSDLGQATITSNVPTTNSAGQITKLTVDFNGKTDDGDSGTYSGTMTLTFTYYYSGGGGGRGGAGAGWRFICTGGSLTITYQ